MRSSLLALLITVGMAVPASAQTPDDQQKPAPPPPTQTTKPKPKPVPKLPLGFHGFFAYDTNSMAASSTFEAHTGSGTVSGLGGGGELLNLWRKMFVRFAVSKGSVDGERGFPLDEGFVKTGVPLEIGVRYIELVGGWRTYLAKRPKFALYGGGGLVLGNVSQKSPFALTSENNSKTGKGLIVLGGVEYAVWKYVVAGVEGQYRTIGGVLGDPGTTSGHFGEDNAGGAAIRALVGVRLRR